jgi:hypothetical protein
MSKPDVKFWKDSQELIRAGVRGFNALQELPRMLREATDWGKQFEFAFISEKELAEARSKGWEHVQSEYLDTEGFNTAAGLRFGLTNEGGVVKSVDSYLMLMPKEFRKKQMEYRNKYHEEHVAGTLREQAYAHPSDPEYSKMIKASEEVSSGELSTVMVRSGDQEPVVEPRPLEEK